MMKNRTVLLWIFVLLVLPQTALAAWGENWGEMVWGVPVSVPTLPGVGLIVLAIGLSAIATWLLHKRRAALGLPVLLVLLAIPLVVAAGTVTVPNTFVNGEIADADEVNENFEAVETAVNDNDSLITALETDTASALSTADTALTDAAAAQAEADAAVLDAATAQGTADTNAAAISTNATAITGEATDRAAADAIHDADIATNATAIAALGGAVTGLQACADGLTVADHDTGLLWEKKTGTPGAAVNCLDLPECIDAHDINNKYTTNCGAFVLDGSVYTNFLARLNDDSDVSLWFSNSAAETGTQISGCFAGHCDWRVPNSAELQTVQTELQSYTPGGTHPVLGLASGASTVYWSSTMVAPYDPANPFDTPWYKINSHPSCATFPGIVRACIIDTEAGCDLEHVRAVRHGSCTD